MLKRISLILVLLAALLGGAVPRVQAQAGSASDLIAEVNAYRVANGLSPYSVDGALMSEAQSQSDYQASAGTCTHSRADGSQPADHGISAENVACGNNLSAAGAIYGQWTDALHSATMLGPTEGAVGAGVARSGNMVYYTLDVRRIKGDFTYRPPNQSPTVTLRPGEATHTPNPQYKAAGPVVTSTAKPDGSILHKLLLGETLVQVAKAYGVTLQQIYDANAWIDPTKPVYYAGQVVVIKPPFTQTPTPTITLTPKPPTRTPRPTRTPTRQVTPAPSQTPSVTPLLVIPSIYDVGPARQTIGWVVVAVSLIGAALVLSRGFLKKK